MPRADRMLRGRCGQQTGQRPPLTSAGERSRMVQSERVASRRAHALQHWLCRVSARPSGGPPHSLGEASTAAATRGFPERADACPRSHLKVAVPQSPPHPGSGVSVLLVLLSPQQIGLSRPQGHGTLRARSPACRGAAGPGLLSAESSREPPEAQQ